MIPRSRRIRSGHSVPDDGLPWIADIRTFDIPETIEAAIRNAAPGLVGVTLRPYGGRRMKAVAEQAAAERGARVIWLPMPDRYREYF